MNRLKLISTAFFGLFSTWASEKNIPKSITYFFAVICHLCLFLLLVGVSTLLFKIAMFQDHETFLRLLPLAQSSFAHFGFVASLILLTIAFGSGVSAYNFRENATGVYGWAEIIIGMETAGLGFASFSNSTPDKADAAGLSLILSLIGGIYVIVRGCDNVNKAAQKKSKSVNRKKENDEMKALDAIVDSASSAAKAANAAAELVAKAVDSAKKAIVAKAS